MSGYEVDPAALRKTGGRFVQLADEAAEAKARFAGNVSGHAGANPGFLTSGELEEAAGSWESHVTDLCQRIAIAGALLEESAGGYQELEESVVETLPALGSEV